MLTRIDANFTVEYEGSLGEEIIKQYLMENNINFKREYTFDDLRNPETNHLLRFDFAILNSEQELPLLIVEFDGYQHYEPVEEWGGEEKLLNIQYWDNCKEDYCKEHGIPVLRIPYWEMRNINQILSEVI